MRVDETMCSRAQTPRVLGERGRERKGLRERGEAAPSRALSSALAPLCLYGHRSH